MGRRLDIRIPVAALLALTACGPTARMEAGADPAFPQYSTQELRQAQRSAGAAARQGSGPVLPIADPAPQPHAGAAIGSGPISGPISGAELAQAGIPVPQAAPPAAPLPGAAAAPAPLPGGSGHVGLSDEQDFAAVASRESIESDKERLAAQRAAYQQIQPEALPARQGATDTTVIDFALSTGNPVGQKVYDRPARWNQDKYLRACTGYASQDQAQADFLKNGGPQRDRRGIDPDGDGFACFWDPTPFRLAKQGAVGAPVAREVLPGQLDAGAVGPDGVMVRTSNIDQSPLQ